MQTRSMAKREAAAAAKLPSRPSKTKRAKKWSSQHVKADWDVLPHNLGRITRRQARTQVQSTILEASHGPATKIQDASGGKDEAVSGVNGVKDGATTTTTTECEDAQDEVLTRENVEEAENAVEDKPKRNPKRSKDNPYGLTPGRSPFPDWPSPSADDCEEVYRLLADLHGECNPPAKIPVPSLEVAGCGEVPSVLDALMRTLLSGATTMSNSNMAFQGLVQKYGTKQEGIGQGSIDWNSVRLSPEQDVIEAIKRGGLAKVKARHMKTILGIVYTQNAARREACLKEKEAGVGANVVGAETKTQDETDLEIFKAEHNILSLDYMHGMAPEEVMMELTRYPGIGVKTASCVILFCLRQPSFAVDTHVWRMCKWLRWVPPQASPDDTFSHCEVKVPNHLKYGLHQLFIYHGKGCPRCRAITSEGTEDWNNTECPIEHLLERDGKRKSTALPKRKKGSSKKSEEEIKGGPEDGAEVAANMEIDG